MTREDWLRDAIKEHYKSLLNFSQQIQMPHSTLRRILSPGGVGSASLENLEKICSGLGITLSEFPQSETSFGPTCMLLTDEHEKRVIQAYRNRPELQSVVDRVLEI